MMKGRPYKNVIAVQHAQRPRRAINRYLGGQVDDFPNKGTGTRYTYTFTWLDL